MTATIESRQYTSPLWAMHDNALLDGDADGPIICTMDNWDGMMIKSPRDRVPELIDKGLPEFSKPATYFLYGKDENRKLNTYVGSTNDFARRIMRKDHQDKDWDYCIVMTSTGAYFSETSARYLEHSFYMDFKAHESRGDIICMNKTSQVNPGITSFQEQSLIECKNHATKMLVHFSFDFLNPPRSRHASTRSRRSRSNRVDLRLETIPGDSPASIATETISCEIEQPARDVVLNDQLDDIIEHVIGQSEVPPNSVTGSDPPISMSIISTSGELLCQYMTAWEKLFERLRGDGVQPESRKKRMTWSHAFQCYHMTQYDLAQTLYGDDESPAVLAMIRHVITYWYQAGLMTHARDNGGDHPKFAPAGIDYFSSLAVAGKVIGFGAHAMELIASALRYIKRNARAMDPDTKDRILASINILSERYADKR